MAIKTPERREDAREELPPCPECGSMEVRVVSRVEYANYVRCEKCGYVWGVPHPRRGQGRDC